MSYEIRFSISSALTGKQLYKEFQPFKGSRSNVLFSATEQECYECVIFRASMDSIELYKGIIESGETINKSTVLAAIGALLVKQIALYVPEESMLNEYDQVVRILNQGEFDVIGLRKITQQIRGIMKSIIDVDQKMQRLVSAAKSMIDSASSDGCDTDLVAVKPEDKESLTDAAHVFIDHLSKKSYMEDEQFNVFKEASVIAKLKSNNKHKTSMIILNNCLVTALSSAIKNYELSQRITTSHSIVR
jgi:hypothetical protein